MFKFSTSGHPHASHLCKYGTFPISKWQCMKTHSTNENDVCMRTVGKNVPMWKQQHLAKRA